MFKNPQSTECFVNDNYKGLSESNIRGLLVGSDIVKVPGVLAGHSGLIVRGAGIPGLVICMMDSEGICLIAYMFA